MSNWLKHATKTSFRKRLAVAITAGLLAGVYAPVGLAAEAAGAATEYDVGIVESAMGNGDTQTRYWGNNAIRKFETFNGPDGQEKHLVRYTFKGDAIITENANDPGVPVYPASEKFAAIDWHGYNDGVIDMKNHKLTVNANGAWKAPVNTAGIRVLSSHLTMDNVAGLEINVTNAHSGGEGIVVQGTKSQGSYVDYGHGNAALTINNGYTKGHEVKINT